MEVFNLIFRVWTTNGMYDVDTSALTTFEEDHFYLLKRYFPFWDTAFRSQKWQRSADSITHLYPQLLDSMYYFSLYEKAYPNLNKKRPYSVSYRSIDYQQFNSLLDYINSAGYWTLPYTTECESRNTDGWSYTLEINTPQVYKVVMGESCPTKFPSPLPAIAQEIVKMAGLQNEINLDISWEVFSLNSPIRTP